MPTKDDVERIVSEIPRIATGFEFPVKVIWGDSYEMGGKSVSWGIRCYTWQESDLSTKRVSLPGQVVPSSPVTVMGSGRTYYYKAERDVDDYVEIIVVVGRVGIQQQDGSWAIWTGHAIFLNAGNVSAHSGAVVYTPIGDFNVDVDGGDVYIESPFMSVHIRYPSWGGCQ
jgi:hypothetical protein